TAERGREPGLKLERGGKEITLEAWANELLDELAPIAEVLDRANGNPRHAEAVAWARAGIRNPDALPSARVLDAMRREHHGSHTDFALTRSKQIRQSLMELSLSQDDRAKYARLAQSSLEEQRRLEENETVPFEDFRLSYLAPRRLSV